MLISFNDICIVPSVISEIEHRSECSPFNHDGMLPLFTAPMSSVINEQNWTTFHDNKINTIIPRNVDLEVRKLLMNQTFIAVSLKEFEELINTYYKDETIYICVDIANGHMKRLLNLCEKAKTMYGSRMQLMIGNIANPDTYLEYAKVGIDYIRAGIGTSPVCLTSANNGIHYPMASLLQELVFRKISVTQSIEENGREVTNWYTGEKTIKETPYKSIPKIVADGGFNNFDQIIKALAIGADYVMLGKIFAMSEEACGEVVYKDQIIPTKMDLTVFNDEERSVFEAAGFNDVYINKTIQIPHRKYYGMSTKKAQTEISGEAYKTAEGIETLVSIKYTLTGWLDNFISYLRSAMSYCNSRTLDQFRQNSKIKQISNNSFNAYYK